VDSLLLKFKLKFFSRHNFDEGEQQAREAKRREPQMSRREEIEAKRQRLAELRRQREKKERQFREPPVAGSLIEAPPSSSQSDPFTRDSIDNLVNELVRDKEKKEKEHRTIAVQTEELQDRKTYNRGTQTVESEEEEQLEEEEEDDEEKQNVVEEPEVAVEPNSEQEEEKIPDGPLDVDEVILSSFFAKSFKILNRAIGEDRNILQQYTLHKSSIDADEPQPYTLVNSLTLNHPINSLDTSPYFPDLIAITAEKSLLIYNLSFKKYESRFDAHTQLMLTQFSHFKSNHIFSSGYNGKIYIWDLDSTSTLPYLTSIVQQQTHSYPVLAMDQTNEQNGLIITASTDGKILHWDPQILSKPSQRPIKLEIPKYLGVRYDELTPTCIKNLVDEPGFMIVGSEDGNLYKIRRFDQKVNSDPIDKVLETHDGPITGISLSQEFPKLMLSSSMDWKVYLWNLSRDEPLLQIYKTNAIMDVLWRPKNPTQLGYIYEDIIEILDLSVDNVIPVAKITVGEVLSCVSFTKDGDRVILGSVKGNVFIYDLDIKVTSSISKFKKLYIYE
jgi:WD40 repeat protein